MATQELIDEIASDPNIVGYSGMTDQQIFDSLTDPSTGATRPRPTMTASEVFNQIDQAELNAKTDAQRLQIFDILHMGEINPFGLEADIFQDVFGASTTITNLQTSRNEPISRADELGLTGVSVGSIHRAR